MYLILISVLVGCNSENPEELAKEVCSCYQEAKNADENEKSKAWEKCDTQKREKEKSLTKKTTKEEYAKALDGCDAPPKEEDPDRYETEELLREIGYVQ